MYRTCGNKAADVKFITAVVRPPQATPQTDLPSAVAAVIAIIHT